MNKSFIVFVLIMFLNENIFSQEAEHINGGSFSKKIEYNIIVAGNDHCYNLEGKSILDRIFFGITNSPVEFVIKSSFDGASVFRIVDNSSDSSSLIEIMYLPDSEKLFEMERILSAQVNRILIPGELLNSTSLTISDMEKIKKHNDVAELSLYRDDLYKPYRPQSISFKISTDLSQKLYSKMVMLINNFRAEGIPPIISDGHAVTFRCVVKDELWTLNIRIPQNKALLLSEICEQILVDVKANEFNESKYFKSLDQLDF